MGKSCPRKCIHPSAEMLCGSRREMETGNRSHLIHMPAHAEGRAEGSPGSPWERMQASTAGASRGGQGHREAACTDLGAAAPRCSGKSGGREAAS